MKKSKFTEVQITYALREVEAGNPLLNGCRKLGITEQTFYRWKKRLGSLGVPELRKLRQLEEENLKPNDWTPILLSIYTSSWRCSQKALKPQ